MKNDDSGFGCTKPEEGHRNSGYYWNNLKRCVPSQYNHEPDTDGTMNLTH
jgi:hypothetical protein